MSEIKKYDFTVISILGDTESVSFYADSKWSAMFMVEDWIFRNLDMSMTWFPRLDSEGEDDE